MTDLQDEIARLVHWVSDAPTSLHGNGAVSFKHTTREPAEVTCKLCLTLLANADAHDCPQDCGGDCS